MIHASWILEHRMRHFRPRYHLGLDISGAGPVYPVGRNGIGYLSDGSLAWRDLAEELNADHDFKTSWATPTAKTIGTVQETMHVHFERQALRRALGLPTTPKHRADG